MFQIIELHGGKMIPDPTQYRIIFQGKYLAAIWIYVESGVM